MTSLFNRRTHNSRHYFNWKDNNWLIVLCKKKKELFYFWKENKWYRCLMEGKLNMCYISNSIENYQSNAPGVLYEESKWKNMRKLLMSAVLERPLVNQISHDLLCLYWCNALEELLIESGNANRDSTIFYVWVRMEKKMSNKK